MCFKASQVRFLGLWYLIKKALSSTVWELLAMPQKAMIIFAVLTKMGRGCPFCAGRFGMRSALLCASIAEELFLFRDSGASADAPLSHFHGRGRKGKRHLQRCFRWKRIPNHSAQKERRCCRSFLLSHGRDCAILVQDETKVYLKTKKRYQVHENSRKRFYPRRQVPCR